MWKNLPNCLSFVRLLCAVLLLLIININPANKVLLFVLFATGAITDWLDGYIAKNFAMTSKLGEIIDPIADKSLVICALLVLIHFDNDILLLSASAIIILREFIISAIRQILSSMPTNPLKVNYIARVKASIQMLGIGTCMFSLAFNHIDWYSAMFYKAGISLIILSAIITIVSFVLYFNKIKPHLFQG